MKLGAKIGMGLGIALLGAGVLAAVGVAAVYALSESAIAKRYEAHEHVIPVPFPLTQDELVALGDEEGVDVQALALQRAVERGRHLAAARYFCVECHGADLGGGVMMEAPIMGMAYGSNLTTGQGSVVSDYTVADWERTVRHGVLPGGRGSFMPAEDFHRMSDRELSDLIAYIRSVPPVDADSRMVSFGPMGRVLLATGGLAFAAEEYASGTEHTMEPPPEGVSVAFGEHLASVCVGCHQADFAGGDIGADPAWPPAANITPHADGLGSWSQEDFRAYLKSGAHPQGKVVQVPMSMVLKYTRSYTPTEVDALWVYLRGLPPRPGN